MRLLVATTNAGKLRDFANAAGPQVQLEPMPGLKTIAAPDEDQDSFEGNAALKAVYYSNSASGKIVIADDSGLEVDALGGAPGVRSARYADDSGFEFSGSSDERNNACLLAALRFVPVGERRARYRCALVAARNGKVLATGVGAVEGGILEAPRGSGGFGYDPFFVPEGENNSMAEIDPGRRITISHRGRALADLLQKLRSARDVATQRTNFAQ